MDWYQDLMAIDWEATADFILDNTTIIGENETPTSPDVTTTDPVSTETAEPATTSEVNTNDPVPTETAEPATGSEITTNDPVPTDAVTSSETETTSVSTAAEADSTNEETTTGAPGAIECSRTMGYDIYANCVLQA